MNECTLKSTNSVGLLLLMKYERKYDINVKFEWQ